MESSSHFSPDTKVAPDSFEPKLSRIECLGGVIVSPVRTFKYLRQNPRFFYPALIVVLWILASFVVRWTVIMSRSFVPAMAEAGVESPPAYVPAVAAIFFGGFGLLVGMVAVSIVFLAMVFALHFSAQALGVNTVFLPLTSGLAYAEFVPRLARAIVRELVMVASGDMSMSGSDLPTGVLGVMNSLDLPVYARPLFARLELFHLWSFALIVILLESMFEIPRKKAILATAIYWAICIGTLSILAVMRNALAETVFPFS